MIRLRALSSLSQAAMKKYDCVIYGATGFTGQFAVEELARVAEKEKAAKNTLKWAIAGRNKEKLAASLAEARKQTGLLLDDVDIVLADNKDLNSINSMTSQSKCVINCVGPYQLYGEPVIRACIENGANHVDISGETQFLESMQLKYDKAAEEAGVHIIGACGFDSIPTDVGVSYMAKNFKGRLNSVESYLKTEAGPAGASIHTGTMESAALVVANNSQVQEIRNKLYPQKLPKPKFPKDKRGSLHKSEDLNVWALRFPSDEPQVYRTQRYFYEHENKQPIQFNGFMTFKNFPIAIGATMGILYFLFMSYFRLTRALLFKFPEILTAGVFSRKGPKRHQLEKVTFTHTLIGKGWSESLENDSDQFSSPPDSKIILKVGGTDPGYAATSLMMVASAVTLVKEKEKCIRKGGVMTPGIVFYNTDIIPRMIQQGLTFELGEQKKIEA